MNWWKRAQRAQYGPLGQQLLALRQQMAVAAQGVYNQWEQSEDGLSDEFGGGGICDQVSHAISGVIAGAVECEMTEGGQDGDDHSYLIVYNEAEAYAVDIPPSVYETGGGYSWKKIPGVVMDASDVLVSPMDRSDLEF